MTIESGLYAELAAHVALAALVGTRIYPNDHPPRPTLPMVTYKQVAVQAVQVASEPTTLQGPIYQLTSWGTTYTSARAVAAQVLDCLDGFAGKLGTGVLIEPEKAQIAWVNQFDLPDPDTGWKRVVQDFQIWQ